ncbi:unnamed protein product [Auanema sp. JU1783]|nr:unnamed protein product [Auanema sp. JU1783]
MVLRWAVSLKKSELLSHFELLFRNALSCLPNEVFTKQALFHFRDDSLASVVGQLLIRSAIVHETNCRWEDVLITKGHRGKPMSAVAQAAQLDFNISHQGDYVVLATSRSASIGVDVMRVNEERDRNSLEHIERMSKLFTDRELNYMKSNSTDQERWQAFYRIWCLKESVLKATGTGLVDNLRNFSFKVEESEKFEPGCSITTTQFYEKDVHQENWLFEESFVDNEHCVAVGRLFNDTKTMLESKESLKQKFVRFEIKSLEELLSRSTSLHDTSEDDITEEYSRFIRKPCKNKQ